MDKKESWKSSWNSSQTETNICVATEVVAVVILHMKLFDISIFENA